MTSIYTESFDALAKAEKLAEEIKANEKREFEVTIPNELLHEIIDSKLDERDHQLKEEMRMIAYEMTMKALYNAQPQTQQPVRSPDDLLWKDLTRIVRDEKSTFEEKQKRIVATIADFAAKNNKPSGQDIHQILNAVYLRLS